MSLTDEDKDVLLVQAARLRGALLKLAPADRIAFIHSLDICPDCGRDIADDPIGCYCTDDS